MSEKPILCPTCGFEAISQNGWRKHMSRAHGGYTEDQSKSVGLTGSSEHLKGLAGYASMAEAKAAAPATEGEGSNAGSTTGTTKRATASRSPRMSAEDAKTAALKNAFEQNKPIHIRRWERKIKIVHQLNCIAFGGDMPGEAEIREGAELHYEMCVIMEWFTYSKYEVLIDVGFWWVKSIIAHNPHAQALIAAFKSENLQADPESVIPIDTPPKDEPPIQ